MLIFDAPRPQLKIHSQDAYQLLHHEPAQLAITREKGGLRIENPPVKLELDNEAFFDALGLQSISSFAAEQTALSKQAVGESMARYARMAEILSTPHNDAAASQIAELYQGKSMEMMLTFIPEAGPVSQWSGGGVDIEYTPDKLHFHWDTGVVEVTYIPYSVQFSLEE